jgi:hypothetical protein
MNIIHIAEVCSFIAIILIINLNYILISTSATLWYNLVLHIGIPRRSKYLLCKFKSSACFDRRNIEKNTSH